MAADQSLRGKRIVITGGTAGLGVGIAKEVVRLGASKLWLVCRSQHRGEKLEAELVASSAVSVEIVLAELSSMTEVHAAAQLISSSAGPSGVDLIFLNAGVMPGAHATMTAEGIETALAVNVVSQHIMMRTLAPVLSPGARIIVTGSDAGSFTKWTVDLTTVNGSASMGPIGFKQYARTKCLAHIHAAAFCDQLERAAIDAHCCVFHPGAVDSQMGDQLAPCLAKVVKPILRTFFRTPVQAAEFGTRAATAPDPRESVHRAYFEDGNLGMPKDFTPRRPIPGGEDGSACKAAWNYVEELVVRALKVDALPPLASIK